MSGEVLTHWRERYTPSDLLNDWVTLDTLFQHLIRWRSVSDHFCTGHIMLTVSVHTGLHDVKFTFCPNLKLLDTQVKSWCRQVGPEFMSLCMDSVCPCVAQSINYCDDLWFRHVLEILWQVSTQSSAVRSVQQLSVWVQGASEIGSGWNSHLVFYLRKR